MTKDARKLADYEKRALQIMKLVSEMSDEISALRTPAVSQGPTREAVATAICQSGKFETGQGTCALTCMDQLGDVRKKGCSHSSHVHSKLADAILALPQAPVGAGKPEQTPGQFYGDPRKPASSEAPAHREAWQPIEKAPIDEWVLLADSGNYVSQAVYGEDEENPRWRLANGQYLHANFKPLAWMPMPVFTALSPSAQEGEK